MVVGEPASERSETAGSSTLSEVYGERSESEQVEAPEELLDEIRVLVSSVLDAMGFEARVEVYDAGGFIAADVAPDNTALFIGQKGETIDALQYLVNLSAFRERPYFKGGARCRGLPPTPRRGDPRHGPQNGPARRPRATDRGNAAYELRGTTRRPPLSLREPKGHYRERRQRR